MTPCGHPEAPRKALLHSESGGGNSPAAPTKAIAHPSREPRSLLAPRPSGVIFGHGYVRDSPRAPRDPLQNLAPFRVWRNTWPKNSAPHQGYRPPASGPLGHFGPRPAGTNFGWASIPDSPWKALPHSESRGCHAPADPHQGYNPPVSGPWVTFGAPTYVHYFFPNLCMRLPLGTPRTLARSLPIPSRADATPPRQGYSTPVSGPKLTFGTPTCGHFFGQSSERDSPQAPQVPWQSIASFQV